MPRRDPSSTADSEEQTIKTAGQIVKYSREMYHLESVEEVAMITAESVPHIVDGHPNPAVIEIRPDTLRTIESLVPGEAVGQEPSDLVDRAYNDNQILLCADDELTIEYVSDDITRVQSDAFPSHSGGVTLAAPSVYTDKGGNFGAVLVVHWDSLETVKKHHLRPIDFLAEHVATAIVNIRSRERLERARNDLAKRKEMVEVYERLLRHDLGNDLQVITGFSDSLRRLLEEENVPPQAQEYTDKIFETSKSAAELIDSVGDTVKTIQEQSKAKPLQLRPVLTEAIDNVETKYDSLTVDYDPAEFEYRAYMGELIESVFANILSNAAVHNDKPVTVRLSVKPTQETIVISMADNGTGIADEVVEDLFEMGKKGPDSDGTGFGLGLAKSLVESYGGYIDVGESEFGGAEFHITLDRA
ncbi:sensor histidine kinase [Halovenus rubra]|uniref:Sensor histidine kinase n=2 Tax=Halovenus rubra TaxID=869890 RepID=A0ABD5XEG6_9EURY|nr:HAMP domain-containing sensor histidine kinase [Halovenus rubra]